ncbi:MAG: CSLREA domain-containing protein [Chloroflexi bacterium]|nr:CSLREA domain-containing protein [Chloroflexota bacterium]
MNQLYRVIWVVCLLATAVLFSAPPRPAYAATFVVTKTADTADGTCDADCSLREAIIAANAAAGADVITVPAGTYTLSIAGTGENAGATGDLDITGNLTINGAGASTTIINANSIDRVFHGVTTAGTTLIVAISDITIRGGNLPAGITNMGGGFASDSTTTGNTNLTLNNVQISNNTTGNNGGAVGFIKNAGAANHVLTITNSTIANNLALNGGGLVVMGALSMSHLAPFPPTEPPRMAGVFTLQAIHQPSVWLTAQSVATQPMAMVAV